MTGVITWVFDYGDGVCIGGNNPPPHFKPMTNTELTLDQMHAITGGLSGLIVLAGLYLKTPPTFKKPDEELDSRLINPDSYQSHQK